MKKGLIGCLVIFVVLSIGGAIASYYYIWRPAKAYVVEFAKLQEIPQLNRQVQNTATFTPPPGNMLTNGSVERFVQTQEAIKTKLGQQVDQLGAKYKQLLEGGPNYKPTWTELTGAYKDMAGLIVEAKRAQVDALNQNRYSLAEYEWTRKRVYEAAGIPMNAEFEKILGAIAEGKTGEEIKAALPAETSVATPEKNRELVKPHIKGLTERAGLAAFGL